MSEPKTIKQIITTVMLVPEGRVASYGQIADLAGLPGRARLVGKSLRTEYQEQTVPWFRIVRSDGKIAFPPGSAKAEEQRQQLVSEGITVKNYRVAMKQFQWQPDLTDMLFRLQY